MNNGAYGTIQIRWKKLDTDAICPKKAFSTDSGFDLYAIEDKTILPKNIETIGTGIAVETPDGFEFQIRSRSGLAHKNGVAVLNSPGTIDMSYRGEWKVILINLGKIPHKIKKGDKIAQAVLAEVIQSEFVHEPSTDLRDTDRGAGGIGHTGR